MSTPQPPPIGPSAPTSIAAQLERPWVRHAIAFALAIVVPTLLRVLAPAASTGTGFLDFLALALGFGLMLVGVLLYAWWLYTGWANREAENWNGHWRLGQGATALSRHPAWLGVMSLVLGQALIGTTPSLLVWAVLVLVGLNVLVTRYDEPRLAREHGEEYEAYRTRVARWLPWGRVLQTLREIGQVLRNSVRK